MSRHLKGAIVEWVEHPKTKRRTPLRLDKRTMTFFGREHDEEAQTEPFSSKDGDEVRRWLLEQLKHTQDGESLEWLPVVKIKIEGRDWYGYRDQPEHRSESVELTLDRYWIALTHDQREWRQLVWNACIDDSVGFIADAERYAESRRYGDGPKSQNLSDDTKPFRLPQLSHQGEDCVLLYTPELWAALQSIAEMIKTARENLEKLVGTKTGVARLLEVGRNPLMLTEGGKDDAPPATA